MRFAFKAKDFVQGQGHDLQGPRTNITVLDFFSYMLKQWRVICMFTFVHSPISNYNVVFCWVPTNQVTLVYQETAVQMQKNNALVLCIDVKSIIYAHIHSEW